MQNEIPAFHYIIAVAGGDSIRRAPYIFGSKALSVGALNMLNDRLACLLANHGLIALGGDDLSVPLALALEVETLCEQYTYAQLLGAPIS